MDAVSDIDALKQNLAELKEDLQERLALVVNAQDELRQHRSDLISELGHSPADSYLKARFIDSVDAASSSLKRALK